MRFSQDGNLYVVVLKEGEELFDALNQFAKQNSIGSAWFEAFGAALEVELGYYRLDEQQYIWRKFSGPLEITNLHGNIVQKGDAWAFHAHGSFADDSYHLIAGHIKRLVVAGTCEILLTKLDIKLTRKAD